MTSALPGSSRAGYRWAACAASVTGREHRHRGLGCDDAYSFGITGDFVVAAVADGAGSVTGTSAWGAYIACRAVLDNALRPDFVDHYRHCAPNEAEGLIHWLFESALERVTRQAALMDLDSGLLATTLSVGVTDYQRAVFGQVGDGVIAAECDGMVETLLIERKDGYANTTSFLQSDHALDHHLRTTLRTGVTAFALSTDGMLYKITDVASGQAYEPFFLDSWQHVRAGASADKFGELLNTIEDDQTGDDKTMVLVATVPTGPQSSDMPPESIRDHSIPPSNLAAETTTVPIAPMHRHRRRTWFESARRS